MSNKVFNYMLEEGGEKINLFGVEELDERVLKARKIREGMETYLMDPETGELDTRPSSHLMAHDYMEVDGKGGWYAWPTLFPGYDTGEETLEWGNIPDKFRSFTEAKARDELFEFSTEEEAEAFAMGSWKPEAMR